MKPTFATVASPECPKSTIVIDRENKDIIRRDRRPGGWEPGGNAAKEFPAVFLFADRPNPNRHPRRNRRIGRPRRSPMGGHRSTRCHGRRHRSRPENRQTFRHDPPGRDAAGWGCSSPRIRRKRSHRPTRGQGERFGSSPEDASHRPGDSVDGHGMQGMRRLNFDRGTSLHSLFDVRACAITGPLAPRHSV